MTATADTEQLRAGLLIGSRDIDATASGTLVHRSPVTGRSLGTLVVAGPTEVDEAVETARSALSGWRARPAAERREILQQLAAAIRREAAEFARLSTAESGILAPVAATMGPATASWFEYYAGWIDKVAGELHMVHGAFDYSQPEPYGVIGILLTWNSPAATIGATVAPALAAGCTVVLKPPELAPFTSELFGRLCRKVGLPDGVLNIVGGGPATGEYLIRHHDIDKISFTGGRDIARQIQASSADAVTPLVLELGGKSANIVFPDADLDYVADCTVAGLLALNGQTCIAPTRLLAHTTVHEQLLDRIVKRLDATTIGDPVRPETSLGPLISSRAIGRMTDVVDTAVAEGAERLTTDAAIDGVPEDGCFVRPIVLGASADSTAAQTEIFGPVLTATPFDDEDGAVAMANDSEFGLSAYLYTNDITRALTVASRLDVGNVAINGPSPLGGPTAPFGGFKDSGYGKQGGRAGLFEFIRTKNVVVHTTRPF